MKKFAISLPSESGYFLYVGLHCLSFVLIVLHPFFIVLYLLGAIYLWRGHRLLLWCSLVVSLLIGLRAILMWQQSFRSEVVSGKGFITEVNEYSMNLVMNGKKYRLTGTFDYDVGSRVAVEIEKIPRDEMEIEGNTAKLVQDLSMGVYHRWNVRFIEEIAPRWNVYQLRQSLFLRIQEQYPAFVSEIILSLVFAQRSPNEDFLVAVRQLGISHLFALSGMHLAFFLGIIKILWIRLFLPMRGLFGAQMIFLCGYLVLTAFPVSLVRASVMALLIMSPLSKYLSKTDLFSFTFLSFLLVNPFLIAHAGFQLSFLVTLIILLNLSSSKPSFRSLLFQSIMIFLWTLPIVSSLQGGFHPFAVLHNIVFTPLVISLLLPLSLITLVIPMFSPVLETLYTLFQKLVLFLSELPFFIPIHIPWSILLIGYVGCLGIAMGCFARKEEGLRWLTRGTLLLCIMILPWSTFVGSKVSVLDVNQGDATLIETSSCTALIDVGISSSAPSILNRLDQNNIHTLDLVIITHRHFDHDGSLAEIARKKNIRMLVLNQSKEDDPLIPVIIPQSGDIIQCGLLEFQVLHAFSNDRNENNNSLVIQVQIDRRIWLFMGDLEAKAEHSILSMLSGVDFLHVGHHGSITSSSKEFLHKTSPQQAIISVGKFNSYLHPDPQILELFKQFNIPVIRTDTDGSFVVQTFFWGGICLQYNIRFSFIPWWNRFKSTQFCKS